MDKKGIVEEVMRIYGMHSALTEYTEYTGKWYTNSEVDVMTRDEDTVRTYKLNENELEQATEYGLCLAVNDVLDKLERDAYDPDEILNTIENLRREYNHKQVNKKEDE